MQDSNATAYQCRRNIIQKFEHFGRDEAAMRAIYGNSVENLGTISQLDLHEAQGEACAVTARTADTTTTTSEHFYLTGRTSISLIDTHLSSANHKRFPRSITGRKPLSSGRSMTPTTASPSTFVTGTRICERIITTRDTLCAKISLSSSNYTATARTKWRIRLANRQNQQPCYLTNQ